MEGRSAGGGCDGGVLTRHSAENWKNMPVWRDPASLTRCCLFSTALATRSVWLEQISSLTPAFWTHVCFLCLKISEKSSALLIIYALIYDACCTGIYRHITSFHRRLNAKERGYFPWPSLRITSSPRRMRKATCGFHQHWGGCSWNGPWDQRVSTSGAPSALQKKTNIMSSRGAGTWVRWVNTHPFFPAEESDGV